MEGVEFFHFFKESHLLKETPPLDHTLRPPVNSYILSSKIKKENNQLTPV